MGIRDLRRRLAAIEDAVGTLPRHRFRSVPRSSSDLSGVALLRGYLGTGTTEPGLDEAQHRRWSMVCEAAALAGPGPLTPRGPGADAESVRAARLDAARRVDDLLAAGDVAGADAYVAGLEGAAAPA